MVRGWVLYLFFFSCSGLGSPGRFRRVRVGPLEWVLWLAAVCLGISVLGICSGIAVSLSGGVIRRPIVVVWTEPESEPQLKMCYPYEVTRDLGTFFQSH